MAICTCIKLKLEGVKFQTFSHWRCWWVKSSGTCHDVVPLFWGQEHPPTVQELLTQRHHISQQKS